MDSIQVLDQVSGSTSHWVDIGSGGGFPGLVVAIMQRERPEISKVSLIESDQRKCAFLRTVLRETETSATILTDRIERAEPQQAKVLSARALADLPKLLDFAERHLAPGGICIFPKGASWEKEVEDAKKAWSFDCEVSKSKTEAAAVILRIGDLKRV